MPGIEGDRFGSRADDYARHRAEFPAASVDRLVAGGVGLAGQRLLDLGCGTGTLARQFGARGCRVTGLDVDGRMLAAARRMAVDDGVSVEWCEAPAEDTGLPGTSFDAVVAAQCWHWFDGDAAAVEARRLLVAGGLLAICNFDWLPLPGSVSGETEDLIAAHNPSWDIGGIREPLPPAVEQVERAGLELLETWVEDQEVPYRPDSWRHRIGASAGIVNLSPEVAAAFDADLERLLAERFPGDEVVAPHRVSVLVARAPAPTG